MSTEEYTEDFKAALSNLPNRVFNKVKETVDSDQRILVGRWMKGNDDGTVDGCLMCDGLAACEPVIVRELLPHAQSMKYTYGEHIDVLLRFYDVEDWRMLEDVARAFDDWVYGHSTWGMDTKYKYTEVDGEARTVDYVSGPGRIALRQLFADVKIEREHA